MYANQANNHYVPWAHQTFEGPNTFAFKLIYLLIKLNIFYCFMVWHRWPLFFLHEHKTENMLLKDFFWGF